MASLQRTNNISNANRIYPGQLLLVDGISSPPAGSTAAGRSVTPSQYRVRRGDTLEKIAGRFGISMRQLQQANRINNPHRIFLGQVLLIP
jgi:N-acetylmuramoyl-L-alanine amidase